MLTLFTGNEVRDRDALISEIAKDVAQQLSGQLNANVANMNVAELRGYVRARASTLAADRCRQWAGGDRELMAAVLEQATHLIIRDLYVRPVVTVPTPHVRLRNAA
jgi:hypothetical protein